MMLLLFRHGELDTVTFVDSEDFERFGDRNWYRDNDSHSYVYRKTSIHGRQHKIYLHREIIGATLQSQDVDHIDGNVLNNRRSNLRIVTRSENSQNRHRSGCGSSRHRGVTWCRRREKWQAQAQVNMHHFFLGYFDNEDLAGQAAAKFRATQMPCSKEAREEGQT